MMLVSVILCWGYLGLEYLTLIDIDVWTLDTFIVVILYGSQMRTTPGSRSSGCFGGGMVVVKIYSLNLFERVFYILLLAANFAT